MPTLTAIRCVERNGDRIVGIYGTLAPESSNGIPQEARIRAIDELRGPLEWIHPQHGKMFIQFLTQDGVHCFVCTGPDDPNHNLLNDFNDCS